MAYKFFWKSGKGWRNISEARNAHSNNNPLSRHDLPIMKGNPEFICQPLDGSNELVLEFGYKSLLELQSVLDEGLQRDWKPDIGVGNVPFLTIVAEREGRIRIIEGRGKAFRLQPHAFRHLRQPSVHRVAEDPEVNTSGPEVSGYRETIGSCPDDGNTAFHHCWASQHFEESRSMKRAPRSC